MKKIVSALAFIAGSQVAFAACLGTVHVKLPDSWTASYVYFGNFTYKIPATAPKNGAGYTTIDLNNLIYPQPAGQENTFVFVNSTKVDYPVPMVIDNKDYNAAKARADFSRAGIRCPGDGSERYILENPTVEGQTVVSTAPPDAKYIYFLVPNDEAWMAAIPMVSLDGGQTAVRMKPDPDRCGWFYYAWLGEPVSDNVLFMRHDTRDLAEAIGVNGTAEESDKAQPIPLQTYYEAFASNKIFFIPDPDLWTSEGDGGFYTTDPVVDGICSYKLGALIYDTDASLHPAFSCNDNSGTGSIEEGCQVGALGVDRTTAVTRVLNCIGIHQGIVVDTLGVDKKPHLAGGATGNGVKCFGSAQLFDMLFTYTQGVNEMSCYDMPFSRNKDGRWEFNSDTYTSPGTSTRGGFFPVELTNDATILAADPTQTPVATARTKRAAEGPVYMTPYMRKIDPALGEDAPRMDLVCNGPGWSGGHNCEGKYASAADLYAWYPNSVTGATYDDVWCWGAYCADEAPEGWPLFVTGTANTTGGDNPIWGTVDEADATAATRRNQHFCGESHATFVYKPGQRFSIRGDDDIWVFIDNKLAVDLGGMHLAAPGYVDLDKFVGKSGALTEGKTYDIDIFFCDRRTTMSNINIKTDMVVMQKIGIIDRPTKVGSMETHQICVVKTGNGSCASQLSGGSTLDTICEVIPSYTLTRANGDVVMDSVPVGTIAKGCIDLTNPSSPVISKDKCTLGPGRYYLIATLEGKSMKFAFKVNGDLDITTRDAIAIDTNGKALPGQYQFKKNAMGDEFVPLYISAIADPCQGNAACSDPLEMDVSSAAGMTYTLEFDPGLTIYAMNAAGQLEISLPGALRTIGASGVDTVYVTAHLIGMMTSPTVYNVGVTGRAKASITFFAPTISFMKDSVTTTEVATGDPVKDERWVGGYYKFYLAAFKPNSDGTMSLCEECTFPLQLGAKTSPKLELLSDSISIVKGRATVTIRSLKEYRTNDNADKRDPATLHIAGENPNLTSAIYTPLFFREPPEGFDPNSSSSAGNDSKSSSSSGNGSNGGKDGDGNKDGSSSSSGNGSKGSSNSNGDGDDSEEFAPPSFHIELSGAFSFKIVFDKNNSRSSKKYAVMDMMGSIIEQGETYSTEASVSLKNAGSYIVRVGRRSTVVNVSKIEEK